MKRTPFCHRLRPGPLRAGLALLTIPLALGCRSDATRPLDELDVELTAAPVHHSIASGQDENGVLVTCDLEFRLTVSGGTVDLGHVAEFTYRTDHLLQQHTTLGRVFGESARAGQVRSVAIRRTFWGPYEIRLQVPWRPRSEGTLHESEVITRCE